MLPHARFAQAEVSASRRYWPVIATCCIGIVLVLFASALLWQKNAKDVDAEFRSVVEGRIRTMQVGLGRYEDIVSALCIYLSGAGGFPGTRKFVNLASGLLSQYDGVQALSWVPRVTSAARADFEARAREDGLPDFRITDRTPDGRWIPAGDRDEYYPTRAHRQFRGVDNILGFDLGSDPERRRTLERARDTGKPAVTAPVYLLIPGRDGDWGVLIFSPIYAEGAPTATVEERRAGLVGFALGVFRVGDMVEAILDRTTVPLGLDQYFFVGPAADAARLTHIHQSRLRTAGQALLAYDEIAGRNGIRKIVTVADRQWMVVTVPIPGMFSHAPPIEAWGVLLAGFAATALGTLYVQAILRRTEHLRALADALSRRDAFLDAVATSASELLHSSDPGSVLANVLERVGSAAGASRVHLFEMRVTADGRGVADERCRWDAPGFAVPRERERVKDEDMTKVGIGSWVPRLKAGEAITGVVRNFEPPVRAFLQPQGALAVLVIPVFVDGHWWGQVAFDNCKDERAWSAAEIDTVKTLAELIGGSLARARHIKELADAARIVEGSPTILFRLAPEESAPLVYISDNVKRLGYHAEDMLASPRRWQQVVHPDDRHSMMADMRDIIEGRSDYSHREFRWIKPDGSLVWLDGRLSAVRDSAHRLIALEGTGIDISERKAAEDKIAELARTDVLTTLHNRTAFVEQLSNVFAAAKRGGTRFSLFYLDLDYFKDVNDTLGHPIGDRLLQVVAERLRYYVRESDLVARFGGDEFAVLQAGAADPADAGTLAAKICKELRAPYQIEGNNIRVTVSIGISIFDAALADSMDMLTQADLALYRAKDAGRDGYAFHSEELDRLVCERVSLSEDLRTALERGGELEVHYQPQVKIISGRIVGMEALVRWNHPTRGQLMPADFIPAAERTGTIKALGRWVLDESCRQMKSWRDEGIAPPVIAVNVSAVQFKINHEFEKEVAEIVAKWGLSPNDVELELTESVLLEATQERQGLLEHMRQSGLRISIDDFGTGYSSLDYLRNYQINRLKVAQQFINGVPSNSGDVAITRATLGLAREFGIDVIAEGVETAEQAAFLVSLGCKYAQGYYFSRPVPAEGATLLLRQGRIDVRNQPGPTTTIRTA